MTGAPDAPHDGDRIEMVMPPDARYIRVARLAASGVGAGAGLDIDRIEDLKIAVGEVCATLIEIGSGAPVTLGLGQTAEGKVRVDGSVRVDGHDPDPTRFALTQQILSVIAGDPGFERTADTAMFTFEVSPIPAPAAPSPN